MCALVSNLSPPMPSLSGVKLLVLPTVKQQDRPLPALSAPSLVVKDPAMPFMDLILSLVTSANAIFGSVVRPLKSAQ